MLLLLSDYYCDKTDQLVKAETYAKRAIAALDTAAKPEGVTEEQWAQQKGLQKGLALSSLGQVNIEKKANAQAVANVRAQYPQINLGGHYSPPFRPLLEMDHEEITRRIRLARPDILLGSFGCPKAEKWIAMHYRSLGVPVTIGVGATIDFLAGRVRRAPVWMQRSGLEWTYRLAHEPRRLWKRYLWIVPLFSMLGLLLFAPQFLLGRSLGILANGLFAQCLHFLGVWRKQGPFYDRSPPAWLLNLVQRQNASEDKKSRSQSR